MNIEDILNLKENSDLFDIESAYLFDDENNIISINDKIAIAVNAVSELYSEPGSVIIKNEQGIELGVLCLCKGKKFEGGDILTEYEQVAFLLDCQEINSLSDHVLESNYVVIEKDFYVEYRNDYFNSASIWGGFSHNSYISTSQPLPNHITAISGINFPTSFHKDNADRSITLTWPFEKYLKLYHILELSFDYYFVKKIKGMPDDLNGYGKLISSLKGGEQVKLKETLSPYISNYNELALKLNLMLINTAKSDEIFNGYDKENNALIYKKENYLKNISNYKSFSQTDFNIAFPNSTTEKYEEFIFSVTIYCIYRLRCCIAHSKIGEYVMTSSDEGYIDEFGLPLIKELLKQYLVNMH
ncbi:TPA: hypothetical protein ACXR7G_002346 [Yersinia enterocolitica]